MQKLKLSEVINQYYTVLDSANLPILWALLSETQSPVEIAEVGRKPTDVEATIWTGGRGDEEYIVFDGEQEVTFSPTGGFNVQDEDGRWHLIRAYVRVGTGPGMHNL